MLLIEYVGHKGLRSLTDGHLGHHLEYFKTLNDARVASVGFIKYNASTTRINKEKNFKIKFQVILVFYQTKFIERSLYLLAISICKVLKARAMQNSSTFQGYLSDTPTDFKNLKFTK